MLLAYDILFIVAMFLLYLYYLFFRYDIMEQYVYKHDFSGWFLPIALRSFFFKLSTSTRRQNHFIANLLDAFSRHYCVCNPHFAFGKSTCLSLS